MSDEEHDPQFDSIAAAKRLGSSARLQAAFQFLWPYLKPLALVAIGWIVKSVQVEGQFAQVRLDIAAEAEKTREAFRLELNTYKLEQQQRLLAIGKQAAYATGAALGGETPKAWSTKRKDGTKYLEEYERLTYRDAKPKDPQTAYSWLFDDRR